ncbi:MAG: S-layer homology domain-containing protein [Candidatus Pristimantibacillus sp.]
MWKKRWVYALCLTSLLLWSSLSVGPTATANSDAAVQLNKPADKNAGELVTISGTATWDEVMIKVIRPDNTILYFDIASIAEGKFSQTFQLPQQTAKGTYTIVAGKGDITATESFAVTTASSGNGGTPTPTPTPTEPSLPQSGGVVIDGDAIPLTNIKDDEGVTVAMATLQSDALRKAIAQAVLINPLSPLVKISFNESYAALKVQLPADVIKEAAAASPAVVILVQGKAASYQLPLSLSALKSALSQGVSNPKERHIEIEMRQVSGQLEKQLASAAQNSLVELIHAGFSYNLAIVENGRSVDIPSLGQSYTTRTMTVDGMINPSISTVTLFNSETGTFTFVPSVFETVNGVTKVTFMHNSNGVYSIIAMSKSFKDLASHWAKADIEMLASKQIIKGQSSTVFAPDAAITRAEFTALLVRMLNLTNEPESEAFSDVPDTAWYAEAVAAATKSGLVEGYGEGTFQPDKPLTREQLAVLVMRTIQATGTASDESTSDGRKAASLSDDHLISGWARDAVNFLMQESIAQGFPDGTFRPERNVSRAEAAVILKRMLQYVEWINR